MNQWLKQENIVMMATEDKATLPQNEQTEERDRNSSSEGYVQGLPLNQILN